jgi:hypothetical protein
MQDEPTSGGTDAPKPEPTVAGAFQEAKEAFAAAGSVIGANVKKAVKKARRAIKEEGEARSESRPQEGDQEEGEARRPQEGPEGEASRPQEGREGQAEGRKGQEIAREPFGLGSCSRGRAQRAPFFISILPRAGWRS